MALIILVAIVLTEAHSILYAINPSLAKTKANLFWSDSYSRELTIQWYIKFTFDKFFMICAFFSATMVAMRYSFKLSSVFAIIMLYWYIDLFLFWYNYNSAVKTYWVMVSVIILCIIFLIFPDKKTGKYRSME
jgi:hypothetical protein